MSSESLITVNSASFGYGKKEPPVITDVTLTVSSGTFTVFRGPNGSGKSTIIKGILGLANCTAGSVHWNIRRSAAGYVPQESSISSSIPFTAMDLLRYSFQGLQLSIEKIRKTLEAVDMTHAMNTRYGDLSGGQKRRILFARALVADPRILILDEPTANVDVQTESIIEQLIAAWLSRPGVAVLAVSHSSAFGRHARVLNIKEGRLHD